MGRLGTLLILIISGLVVAAGPSQPPLPSGRETRQPPQQVTDDHTGQPSADQRGSEDKPIFIKPILPAKSKEESAYDAEDRNEKASSDWWMVRLTGLIAIVGAVQAIVFWIQAGRLKATIRKMDEIATGQTEDMSKSITQWSRVANAMEDVATAMTENAKKLRETVEIARENMLTSKRIADQQERIGGLQTRAYLTISYLGVVPQNNDTLYRFEPRVQLGSSGLTPAYKIKYRAAADVQPFPLTDDFAFPLPAVAPSASVGLLGPRNSFTLSAPTPKMYSELEISEIKRGNRQRLYVWGIIDYEDAFGRARFLKFAQSIMWLEDGNNTTSFNTNYHNDAN